MSRNIFKVLLSNLCVAVIGIITSFIFPKIMSIDSYSEYQAFNLFLSYIGICQLGLATGMVINYAGVKKEDIDQSQFRSEIFLFLIILFFFSIGFGSVYAVCGKKSFGYLCICVIPYCFVESYKSLYQAWSEFSKYSLVNTIIPVLRVTIVLLIFVCFNTITDKIVIGTTIICYYLVFIFFLYECFGGVKNKKSNAVFSKKNGLTLCLGLRILLGNYLDTLFKTADKLFVNIFFASYDFAMYSFAMAMHNIMNIFVTSIAQPMFPYMASHELEDKEVKYYEELLLIFGAIASCAFFGCAFIVRIFIPKYIDSLDVMFAYFFAFPAISVINCIFINLYKIRKDTRTYILSLIILLITSILLNGFAILFIKSIVAIAIATTIVYYLWFIYGCYHFKALKITIKDVLFVLFYALAYFISSRIYNEIIGATVYILLIIVLAFACYHKTIRCFWSNLIKKYRSGKE